MFMGNEYVGFSQPAHCLHCSSKIESAKFPYCNSAHQGQFIEGMRQYFEYIGVAPSVEGILERMREDPEQELGSQRKTILEGVVVDLRVAIRRHGSRIRDGKISVA